MARTILCAPAKKVLRSTAKEGCCLDSAQADPNTQEKQSGACNPARNHATSAGRLRQAETIVAEFGFKNIKAEACTGPIFDFATRDGKPFSIQIVAASGELAQVRRHR